MEQAVEYQTNVVCACDCKPVINGAGFSSPEAAIGLGKRLSAAIKEIAGLEKRGHNSHFHYDFVTSEDVKWAARKALASQEVAVIPAIVESNTNGKKTRVRWSYTLICPEGYMVIPWESESDDGQDKGLAKAGTASLKYFLIHLLQIPTGDEPDTDSQGPAANGASNPEPGNGEDIEPELERADPDAVRNSSGVFDNAGAAIRWGYNQGAFKAFTHAKNAYHLLKDEKQPTTSEEMAELWRNDVADRLEAEDSEEQVS